MFFRIAEAQRNINEIKTFKGDDPTATASSEGVRGCIVQNMIVSSK
jgi:hypothetical protein